MRLPPALSAVLLLVCCLVHGAGGQDLLRLPPVTAEEEVTTVALNEPWGPCEPADAPVFVYESPFEVGVKQDKGLFVRGRDLEKHPFAMYVGGQFQLRYVGFMRDVETYTDNAGNTRDVRNRNNFDTERAWLKISGTVLDPRLTYLLIYDSDSDGGTITDGLAFSFLYEHSPCCKVRLGRWKAASHREWLESSRFLRFADRSMASEYFRTGFTDGLWLLGDFSVFERCDDRLPWHYEASLTNGLRTSARQATLLDDNLGVCGTLYCDPLGKYGPGFNDFRWHESPVVRLGASFAYDKSDDRSDVGINLGDDGFLRLSDGTRLSATGALAPGVRLLGDRVMLASLDAGVKYRGWSANVEYFMRWLQDFTADGPLPHNKLYDYGFHVDCGKFLIEKRLDVNLRMSQISGLYGNALEYTAGFTCYFRPEEDDRVNKFTFDVTRVIQSSINSTLADILVGDTGTLFRAQAQIGF